MRNGKLSYNWKFFHAGGADQTQITCADDLKNLNELDNKLWSALNCPVDGLYFDKGTLKYLDSDSDGRIRAPEVAMAVEWVCSVLEDPSTVFDGTGIFKYTQSRP